MSIIAICAATDMVAVNAALQSGGFGPSNFSRPLFDGGSRATHGVMHAWGPAGLLAALEADARVTLDTSETGTPIERVQALVAAQGLQWPDKAPELPDKGAVSPGEYYRTGGAENVQFWFVIQQHDRSTYSGDPEQYPALIREARIPGQVREWKQPLDQFDAYLTLNPFTEQPDRVTRQGFTWECTSGSAGGPGGALLNTWAPGEFGWTEI